MSERVVLIGGTYDRAKVTLSATPPTILVSSETYERIDDPDSGASLGGYYCAMAARERP